jgi:chromate reductase, NAD(P)H dehydrogenase (quinone)
MTRILLISGNPREASLHTAALRTAAQVAPPEITAALYAGLTTLPAFVPGEWSPPEPVTRLRQEVAAADAVLLCTPEFAGSLPGSLKNLLDWLVDGGDLTGKPVTWLSLAVPGEDEGARETLESVLGHAAAKVLRSACIRIPVDPAGVDVADVVADPRLHQALQDMLATLVRVLDAHQRPQPSWQAVSSVNPTVQRTPDRPFQNWRAQIWRPDR